MIPQKRKIIMSVINSIDTNDEINLKDLFSKLWYYKYLLLLTCIVGFFLGLEYATSADKKYTASANFKIIENSNGLPLGAGMATLGRLAGLGSTGGAGIENEEFTGRLFIEKLNKKLNFTEDLYFNKYDSNINIINWKSRIKNFLGLSVINGNTEELIFQGIILKYLANLSIETSESGAIYISFTHSNPTRAAEIANTIMTTILADRKMQKIKERDEQFVYLSTKVSSALNDLETSQSRLKTFALENSALPLESFASSSLELDLLREQLVKTDELFDAMQALSKLLIRKNLQQKDYFLLRENFPVIDQRDFRRILGQSEIINAWNWPELSSVEKVKDTLMERQRMLKSEIETSQTIAERFGEALSTYAKLEREAKISEATYAVLIEQLKAENLIAGHSPDRSRIYEYAFPPVVASQPRVMIILALGVVLGFLVGFGMVIILSRFRRVYYSKESMITSIRPSFSASSRSLNKFRKKYLSEINRILKNNSRSVLRDLAIEIHNLNSKYVVITSSRTKFNSKNIAQLLSLYMQSSNFKIAIINYSEVGKKAQLDKNDKYFSPYYECENYENVSILMPEEKHSTLELLSKKFFPNTLDDLESHFDIIYVCADDNDSITLLRAMQKKQAFHISLLKLKSTRIDQLSQMHTLIPIQGLFYE
jgi:uncharacterized protein involved in exopolysaccharide biosynthesis